MSDVMFYGVLRMPYAMAMSDHFSRMQFYDRAQEAANRVETADKRIAELTERLVTLQREATKAIAQLAAPADLGRRLLADHQRVEPHHADQCALCREAQAAIDGKSAQGERQPDLWTPVMESAAPVDTDLLLTISTGKVVVGTWHSGFGWDWDDTGDVADEEASVTHWRRFPMTAGK